MQIYKLLLLIFKLSNCLIISFSKLEYCKRILIVSILSNPCTPFLIFVRFLQL